MEATGREASQKAVEIVQGIENEGLNKERCMEKETDIISNPLMQSVAPRADG